MGVLSEIYQGEKIINKYKSSNIKSSIYENDTKKLIIEFNGGRKYEYLDVPSNVCASFRKAKSQGQYFSKNIVKKYDYKLVSN
jgi:hypothetical protein|tara:strand:- start:14750 stop:14998 length:249 start_codon:yes stop_codon:yes gene_type:complete